jgi:hypothetical protein
VFELEDVDVNPIGCISGKNFVVKAQGYDEVRAWRRVARTMQQEFASTSECTHVAANVNRSLPHSVPLAGS